MATVVNNPQDSSSGPMVGVALLVIAMIVLFLFWGFFNTGNAPATPAAPTDTVESTEVNTQVTPPDTGDGVNVDIPDEVDVNVSQPDAQPDGEAE